MFFKQNIFSILGKIFRRFQYLLWSITDQNYWPCRLVYQPKPQWSSWKVWLQSKVSWWLLWCPADHLATSPSGLDWHCRFREWAPLTRLTDEWCQEETPLTQLLNCHRHCASKVTVSCRGSLAPVVHEPLEILEKQVFVFVQKALDRVSATQRWKVESQDTQRRSESNREMQMFSIFLSSLIRDYGVLPHGESRKRPISNQDTNSSLSLYEGGQDSVESTVIGQCGGALSSFQNTLSVTQFSEINQLKSCF